MDIDHPDPEVGRRGTGPGYGIGNIVEFQIQKNIKALATSCLTNCGPSAVNSSLPTFRRQRSGDTFSTKANASDALA